MDQGSPSGLSFPIYKMGQLQNRPHRATMGRGAIGAVRGL